MIPVMSYSAYDLITEAIRNYRAANSHCAGSPRRIELSPESWRDVCEHVQSFDIFRAEESGPEIMGVPVVVIPGCPPRLFGHDGKLYDL